MTALSSEKAFDDFLRRVLGNPVRALLERVNVVGPRMDEEYDDQTDRLLAEIRSAS